MTVQQALNRGYNLLVCSFLFVSGLAFGTVAFNEADTEDKVDDLLLLGLGIITVAWYFVGKNRFSRSIVPVVFAALMLAAQAWGIFVENSDKEAFGDNIGGAIVFSSVMLISLYQYFRAPKVQAEQTAREAVEAGKA